jgi:hypothetical protein
MRRLGAIAAVLVLTLLSAPDCVASGGPGLTLPGLARCPAPRVLVTEGISCAGARAVLRRFYGNGPLIDPGPSPPGWRCRQREAGPPTSRC